MGEQAQWEVRPVGAERWDDFVAVDSHAFGATTPDDLLAQEREVFEPGRDIAAFDGDTIVGIATAYSLTLTVPGGTVPAAGVSWVGVLPTHRRRGVLRSLMTYQLHQVHDAGTEPVAALWASEPPIYGRYGYGPASASLSLDVDRSPAALRADAPEDPRLRLRLVANDDWKVTAPLYDAVVPTRPGMLARDDRWWRRAVRDVPSLREGMSALRCVVAEDADGVRGYARYGTRPEWGHRPKGRVEVRELVAGDAAALAALYRYLFDLDLMSVTRLWNVPVDDPLLLWLDNARAARPVWKDALHVRIVDLPEALRRRAYAAPLDVTLEVADPLCPWNEGRWRLQTDETDQTGDVRCERTDDPADLALSVNEVGAAYLGGTTLAALGTAGRVVERTPGALASASAAFAHSPAPWCPVVF